MVPSSILHPSVLRTRSCASLAMKIRHQRLLRLCMLRDSFRLAPGQLHAAIGNAQKQLLLLVKRLSAGLLTSFGALANTIESQLKALSLGNQKARFAWTLATQVSFVTHKVALS